MSTRDTPCIEVFHSCAAMATRFELCLVGDDQEHLDAVAHQALDEVCRVERLLSRFDPRSEVSRVNRNAAAAPVIVDVELFEIFSACHAWHEQTDGYFDITATGGALTGTLLLDPAQRTVRFADASTRLDFGGFGKGYALDCIDRLLDEYGIKGALLHGGTSSVLARGRDALNRPWRVGIGTRLPAETGTCDGSRVELAQVILDHQAMSTSGVSSPGVVQSDLTDPHTGRRLGGHASCTVIARSAAEAEALSTALLCMGRERAATYTARIATGAWSAAWVDIEQGTPRLQWLDSAK